MRKKTFDIDNSAILYLALMRKRHTNVYRFTMTMTERVDPDCLQQAADRVYRRFPTIMVGFRPGFFRYSMVPAPCAPQVRPDPGCLKTMTREEIEHCAYRLYYRDREISFEAFHAVTDGYGAVASFTTLVAEYLRIRHGAQIPVCNTLREVTEEPAAHELEDSYLTSQSGKPLHLPSRVSYQLPPADSLKRVHTCARTYPTERLLGAARREGVSLTALFSGIMAAAIMDIQRRHRKKLQPVRIMVPVDLRRMFHSGTLRNFILYALPTMEPGEERLPLRELLRKFHNQMKEQVQPGRMAAIMAYNVRMQASLWFRWIPLAVKCAVMRLIYRFFGESNSSITLTNLGNVQLPAEMEPYVEGLQVILTPRAGSPYNCAVISCGGRITINLSRFCPSSELEEGFFHRLEQVMA